MIIKERQSNGAFFNYKRPDSNKLGCARMEIVASGEDSINICYIYSASKP